MVEFTLFRIPIRVEPFFWITMGLLGYLINSNLPSDAILMGALLFIIAGFISILIHELGHALMVKKYKYPTEIVLSSFGGYATHPIGVLSRKQSFLVTLAGPLLQALFGAAIFIAQLFISLPDSMIKNFVGFLWVFSIMWAVFNCVPVIPLDGGRMLEAALGPRKIKLTLTISLISAVALCVLGFSFGFHFAGIFMAMFAFQNYQALERFK